VDRVIVERSGKKTREDAFVLLKRKGEASELGLLVGVSEDRTWRLLL